MTAGEQMVDAADLFWSGNDVKTNVVYAECLFARWINDLRKDGWMPKT